MLKLRSFFQIMLHYQKYILMRSLYVPFVDWKERSPTIVVGSGPSFLRESCKFSPELADIVDTIL